MVNNRQIRKSIFISLWFGFLTFPLMVIKADGIEKTVHYRWENLLYVVIGTFILSILSSAYFSYKKEQKNRKKLLPFQLSATYIQKIANEPKYLYPLAGAVLVFPLLFPLLFSSYQTNIMASVLISSSVWQDCWIWAM